MARPIRKGQVSRSDLYRIDPKVIKIIKGRNPRVLGLTTTEHIDFLKESIKTGGWWDEKPALIKYNQDGNPELIHGECRLTAVMKLIKSGVPIVSIPCIIKPKHYPEHDIILANFNNNIGQLPLTDVEQAEAFRRLIKLGWTVDSIAKKVSKKKGYVTDLLVIMDGDADVRKALKLKKIGKGLAKDIVKKSGGDVKKQKEQVKKASSSKKGKEEVKKELGLKVTPEQEKKQESVIKLKTQIERYEKVNGSLARDKADLQKENEVLKKDNKKLVKTIESGPLSVDTLKEDLEILQKEYVSDHWDIKHNIYGKVFLLGQIYQTSLTADIKLGKGLMKEIKKYLV